MDSSKKRTKHTQDSILDDDALICFQDLVTFSKGHFKKFRNSSGKKLIQIQFYKGPIVPAIMTQINFFFGFVVTLGQFVESWSMKLINRPSLF